MHEIALHELFMDDHTVEFHAPFCMGAQRKILTPDVINDGVIAVDSDVTLTDLAVGAYSDFLDEGSMDLTEARHYMRIMPCAEGLFDEDPYALEAMRSTPAPATVLEAGIRSGRVSIVSITGDPAPVSPEPATPAPARKARKAPAKRKAPVAPVQAPVVPEASLPVVNTAALSAYVARLEYAPKKAWAERVVAALVAGTPVPEDAPAGAWASKVVRKAQSLAKRTDK